MAEAKDWLRLVAAAHNADADIRSEKDVTVRRVTGGSNNALYQISVNQERYACKLCVRDKRRRAAQEYNTLCVLQAAGLDLAPPPIYLDESCALVPYPAVIYRWVAGKPLVPPLPQPQLAALLSSLQQIHSVRKGDLQTDLGDSWFHWFDWNLYTQELHGLLDTYGPWLMANELEGSSICERLACLVEACAQMVKSATVSPEREHVTRCLCRVDPNLANTVWGTDKRLRWVDWEYSGWGDPALDVVEVRWHAALSGLSDAQHTWLRENCRRPADDGDFDQRVTVWDHIIAVRWCFLVLRHLWTVFNGPDRVRLSQKPADADDVRYRLVRFIERAEKLIASMA
jgi:aminoglycoside phosphotransferase (APT) family kinase protein